ncbi:MAG: serine/threonine-protein kinase, partial [Anaerolineales bacterium]
MPSFEDQNLIGKILNDRYRLDAVLGRGGMGVVYRAHDTLIEREVAVKVLAGGNLGTEGQVRLLQEARAAGRLNHPNIVTIFDVGEEIDHTFIVMELIDGPSLFDHQPVNLTAIIKVARQVCAALEHAHA